MANQGFICIHRQIKDHWAWREKKYTIPWIDIILSANHKDNKIVFDGKVITVKRGQFITSQRALADSWDVSLSTVNKYLNVFEADGMIKVETTKKRTLITVVNYDVYQIAANNARTIAEQSANNARTIAEQNNNDNNVNNVNTVDNDDTKEKRGTGKETTIEQSDDSPHKSFSRGSPPQEQSNNSDLETILSRYSWSEEEKHVIREAYKKGFRFKGIDVFDRLDSNGKENRQGVLDSLRKEYEIE